MNDNHRFRKKKLTQIPLEITAVNDYERIAKDFTSHPIYEYIAGGSADELTLRHNRKAFENIKLYNRVLKEVSHGSTRLSLLGKDFKHPILLAPVAHQKLVHPEGEMASAEAARAMEAGFITSTLSSVSMEDIANNTGNNKWFQLYFQASREHTLSLVRRAEKSHYKALIVTVDAPINGLRNRAQKAGFTLPRDVTEINLATYHPVPQRQLNTTQRIIFQGIMADAPGWEDLEWLQQQTELPIIVKGIIHPQDAKHVMDMGLAGIVASNHGGRALDSVPAAIELLPEIRSITSDTFTILVDGGIQRGADIFKAIALGANAVLIGRPQIYALAVAGALGVAHMLRLLREELEVTMALAGCATLEEINPDCLYSYKY